MNSAAPILPEALLAPVRHRLSSDDRRKQLIASAIDLFAKRGFAGTRTKDIAAACGVSEGILFRHFATKEDLYHAILDTHQDQAGGEAWCLEMTRLAEARDDDGLVQCLVTFLIKSFREEASFHRLMIYARLEGHRLGDLVDQRIGEPFRGFLRDYVVLRQKEKAFRSANPDALVMFLFATPLQYALSRYVFELDLLHVPEDEAARELTPLILSGLRGPLPVVPPRSPKTATKRGRKAS